MYNNLLNTNNKRIVPNFSDSSSKNIVDTRVILNTEVLQQMMQSVALTASKQAVAELRGLHLDNSTEEWIDVSREETKDMATQMKIRRPIMIAGEKRWISGNSEQEYAENVIKATKGNIQLVPPSDHANSKHRFETYAQRWFEVFSKPNIETVTSITYERQLRIHINPVIGNMNIEDITSADVQKVFNRMGDASKETKNKAKIVLNMIFEQALEDGFIAKNPLQSKNIRIKEKNSKHREPYSVEQMQYLVQNIDKVKKATDRAYLALMTLHPFSPEEVLGLKGADIDNNMIHIRRAVTHPTRNQPEIKETKNSYRNRELDLVPQAKRHLPEVADDEFVLGGKVPLSYTQVKKMCDRIRKDLQFDDSITPSRFRTTVLTDLYDVTKDVKQVQAAAGHSNASTTMKYYVQGRHQDRNSATPIAALYGVN